MSIAIPLDAIAPGEAQIVGKHTANCAQLYRMGLPLPASVALTFCGFNLFLNNPAISAQYRQLLQHFSSDANDATLLAETKAFQEQIRQQPLPTPVWESLQRYIHVIPNSNYTLRISTDTDVDSHEQHCDGASLAETIVHCWVEALSYDNLIRLLENDINPRDFQVGLLIQEYIEPDYNGVSYSVKPNSSDADNGFIRFSKLTAAEPIEYSSNILRTLGTHNATVRNSGISDALLGSLWADIRLIETHFGQPQEVRWQVRDEQVFFIGTRLIHDTAVAGSPYRRGRFIAGCFGRYGEIPLVPLAISIIDQAISRNSDAIAVHLHLDATSVLNCIDTQQHFLRTEQQRFNPRAIYLRRVRTSLRNPKAYAQGFMEAWPIIFSALKARQPDRAYAQLLVLHFNQFLAPDITALQSEYQTQRARLITLIEALDNIDTQHFSNQELTRQQTLLNLLMDQFITIRLRALVLDAIVHWLLQDKGCAQLSSFTEQLLKAQGELNRIETDLDALSANAINCLNRFYLQLGRRLANRHIIKEATDVFFLDEATIANALQGDMEYSRRYVAKMRKLSFRRATHPHVPVRKDITLKRTRPKRKATNVAVTPSSRS